MNLNTRHFAVLGAAAIGVMNIATSGAQEVTIAAIGIMGLAFTWDKIQNAITNK